MNRLEELVYLVVGRASMCWSEIPRGVFNDTEAKKIAEELIAAIDKHVNEKIKEDQAMQHLKTPYVVKDANDNGIAQACVTWNGVVPPSTGETPALPQLLSNHVHQAMRICKDILEEYREHGHDFEWQKTLLPRLCNLGESISFLIKEMEKEMTLTKRSKKR